MTTPVQCQHLPSVLKDFCPHIYYLDRTAEATLEANEGAEEVDVAIGTEPAKQREAEMVKAGHEDGQKEPKDLLTEDDKVAIQERCDCAYNDNYVELYTPDEYI